MKIGQMVKINWGWAKGLRAIILKHTSFSTRGQMNGGDEQACLVRVLGSGQKMTFRNIHLEKI